MATGYTFSYNCDNQSALTVTFHLNGSELFEFSFAPESPSCFKPDSVDEYLTNSCMESPCGNGEFSVCFTCNPDTLDKVTGKPTEGSRWSVMFSAANAGDGYGGDANTTISNVTDAEMKALMGVFMQFTDEPQSDEEGSESDSD